MSDASDDPLTKIETTLAHVQRLYEQLNDVVTQQSMEAVRTARRIHQLETLVKELKEKQQTAQPPLDPMDEKPPHY